MDTPSIRITHRAEQDCNPAEIVIEIGAPTAPIESGFLVEAPVTPRERACRYIKIAADSTSLPVGYSGTDHVAVLDTRLDVMYALQRLGGKSGKPQRDIRAEAKAVDLFGYDDWSLWLPHEAFAIVRHDRYKPAVDTNLFPCITPDWFWTDQDTHEAWSSSAAFGVGFCYGVVGFNLRNYDGFGLAVRRVGQ